MNQVGYLVKRKDALYGERGMFYDYILAENGVFIEAEGPLLAARVPVAYAEVRGLAPLETKTVLRHGLIPQRIFDLAVNFFLTDLNHERYVAVTWSDGYHIYVPRQAEDKEHLSEGVDEGHGSAGGVAFLNLDNVILDLHSHGKMNAFFSPADNADEKGLRLYAVVGKLGGHPQIRLRVGAYGYLAPISWGDVFEGTLLDMDDMGDEPFYPEGEELVKLDAEEVICKDELHCGAEGQHERPENRGSWLRWDRRVRRRGAVPNPGR